MTSGGHSYYAVLGVTPGFPVEAVEGLRRSLSKLYHPDAGSQPNSELMAAVNEACDVLGNRVLRARYDARLMAAAPYQHSSASAPSPRQPAYASASPSKGSTSAAQTLWERGMTLVIGPASGPASIDLARKLPEAPEALIGGGFGRGRSVGSVLRFQQRTSVYVSLTLNALQFRAAILLNPKPGTWEHAPDGGVLAELALSSITRATHHRVGFARKAIMLWTDEGDWCFARGWNDLGPAIRGQLGALGRVVIDEGPESWAVVSA